MIMKKKWFSGLLLLCLLLALLPVRAQAAESDNDGDGLAADSLTIKVGYFGGPYYEKKVCTISQLQALGVEEKVYSYLDRKPSVVYDRISGVRLFDVLDSAGIDVNSVLWYHFSTADANGGYWTSFSGDFLQETRYSYPDLAACLEDDYGTLRISDEERLWGSCSEVEPMLALTDSWLRYDLGTSYDSAQHIQTSGKRLRLMYGQTQPLEIMASSSAKWVYEIDVQLEGAPRIVAEDGSTLNLRMGNNHTLQVTVNTADSVITNLIRNGLQYSSSDTSVAAVDADGHVTAIGTGSATIMVSYDYAYSEGNAVQHKTISDQITVNVGPIQENGEGGSGSGSGTGTGDSAGTSGSGTGSGSGIGHGTNDSSGTSSGAQSGNISAGTASGAQAEGSVTSQNAASAFEEQEQKSETLYAKKDASAAEQELLKQTLDTQGGKTVIAKKILSGQQTAGIRSDAGDSATGGASAGGEEGGSTLSIRSPMLQTGIFCLLFFLLGAGGMCWKYKREI